MSEPKLDLSAIQRAVASLETALDVATDTAWFNQQSWKVQHTLIAGVIQNFEFVYEISVKMIKRQIERESASPAEVDATNFRDVLQVAAEKGLIADVESWFGYRQMRYLSPHTYDEAKAQQVYQQTLIFITDARALLATLEARNG